MASRRELADTIVARHAARARDVERGHGRNFLRLRALRAEVVRSHNLAATVVGISGIDAAGKGTLATALTALLRDRGLAVEQVGADTWLTPLERLDLDTDPAGEFYRHGIRFDEMFERIAALERSSALDVILAEGIFLFKRELRARYHLSIWLECAFDTALERALLRNQEGLPPDRLIADYRRIYFPAQRRHFQRDDPAEFAEIVHPN